MKSLLTIAFAIVTMSLFAQSSINTGHTKPDSIVYAQLCVFGESDKPGEHYRYTFTCGKNIDAENFDDYMMPFEKYGAQGWVLITCYKGYDMGLSSEMNYIFEKVYKRK